MSGENDVMHPLIQQICDVLCLQTDTLERGISEYKLIELMQSDAYKLFDKDALRDSLTLFRTHFILFHCLYVLRDEWRETGKGELTISATHIQLNRQSDSSANIVGKDPLREYYLDWSHFSQTTVNDVDDLLNDFWQAMGGQGAIHVSEQDISDALGVLKFEPDATPTPQQIKRQYKAMQHRYHPDKGGDIEQSQLVSNAYRILMVAPRK